MFFKNHALFTLNIQFQNICSMKNFLLFAFGLLLAETTFSQNLDTVVNYKFENADTVPVTRIINSYSGCLIATITTQEFLETSSTWRNVSLTTNRYTANSQVDTAVTQLWDTLSNAWINSSRLSYSYNVNNQVSQLLFEIWDTLSQNWVPFNRTTNIYNASNLLDSSMIENNVLGTWQNSRLTVNKYNANKNIDTTTLLTWVLTNWADSSRSFYTYNANTTIKETVYQTWNGSTWVNNHRNAYTYNSSKLMLSDTAEKWNVNQWNDTSLTTNIYTALNVLATTLVRRSNNNGATWINNTRTNFTYNQPGGVIEVALSQVFDTLQNSWFDSTETTYSYTDCTLPITLLNFTATLNGKAAQLQWTTSTEINTKNFIVERSIDGIHFRGIGTVDATGNSVQRTSYRFLDATALNAGTNKLYYRLQMVDKDGRFAYSKIEAVQIVNEKLFVIYPNPVKDQLMIRSNASFDNVQIRIIDQNGKTVYRQQMANMLSGSNNTINVSNLTKGIYYLQWITKSDVQTVKFMKY